MAGIKEEDHFAVTCCNRHAGPVTVGLNSGSDLKSCQSRRYPNADDFVVLGEINPMEIYGNIPGMVSL